MRKIYASDDFLLIGHLRQVLEHNHIACFTRNEHLIGGAGELPLTECWPEIWVRDDAQHERALELVRAMLAIDMQTWPDWRCPRCREEIEGQFSACWRCGTTRSHAD
jgi:hypothetical protein